LTTNEEVRVRGILPLPLVNPLSLFQRNVTPLNPPRGEGKVTDFICGPDRLEFEFNYIAPKLTQGTVPFGILLSLIGRVSSYVSFHVTNVSFHVTTLVFQ